MRVRILFTVAATLVAVGVGTFGTAAASGGGGASAQQVIGSGSDTTQIVMSQLSSLYQFSTGCNQIPTPSGPTAWLDFSCQATDAVSQSGSGTSVTGSSTVTFSPSNPAGIAVGEQVTGPGITAATWPQGVYVGSIPSSTTITLSSSPVSNNAVNADGTAGAGTFNFSQVVKTENYEHDLMTSAYFLGSSNGIKQVCGQGSSGVASISYARSSRAPKSPDSCTGLHFVAYAQDGITWEAFNITGSGVHTLKNTHAPCDYKATAPTDLVPCLTVSELKTIFTGPCSGTGSITNWSQVGGPNLAIDPYTPQSGSGTRSTWDTFLGASSDTCIKARGTAYANTHIIPENANSAILANGDSGKAIFPFSIGVWNTQVKGAHSAVLGEVGDIAATIANVQSGAFPFSRQLFNVYCSGGGTTPCPVAASSATTNFIGEEGWLCKGPLGVNGSSTLTGHVVDPYSPTSSNYFTEIENTITANGFAPLKLGTIGGGDTNQDYCRLATT